VSGYPCVVIAGPGRYTVSYGGVDVAHLDIPSSTEGNRVRANT
jgi:hypothetical protein